MHNDKVALVHCPRTGGTSVQKYMLAHLDGLHVPANVGLDDYDNTVVDDSLPTGHVPVRDFEEQLGRTPDSFELIVATRRDPYKVALSQWRYWRRLWKRGNRLPRHRLAIQHAPFIDWLRNPRSEWHVRYNHYDGKPAIYLGDDAPGYADFGGYYRYWLEVDGAFPDNLTILEVGELEERLPELLAPFADGATGDVPRENSTGDYDPDDYYTPGARRIVESRFRYAFDHWYDRAR